MEYHAVRFFDPFEKLLHKRPGMFHQSHCELSVERESKAIFEIPGPALNERTRDGSLGSELRLELVFLNEGSSVMPQSDKNHVSYIAKLCDAMLGEAKGDARRLRFNDARKRAVAKSRIELRPRARGAGRRVNCEKKDGFLVGLCPLSGQAES